MFRYTNFNVDGWLLIIIDPFFTEYLRMVKRCTVS